MPLEFGIIIDRIDNRYIIGAKRWLPLLQCYALVWYSQFECFRVTHITNRQSQAARTVDQRLLKPQSSIAEGHKRVNLEVDV
jgi:hypothetical protein